MFKFSQPIKVTVAIIFMNVNKFMSLKKLNFVFHKLLSPLSPSFSHTISWFIFCKLKEINPLNNFNFKFNYYFKL